MNFPRSAGSPGVNPPLTLRRLPQTLAVCRLETLADIDLTTPLTFFAATGEELSLVCPEARAPETAQAVERGLRGFVVEGVLDFSLVGILARIAGVLAEGAISIFAISTFNTDYILVPGKDYERAAGLLAQAGYFII